MGVVSRQNAWPQTFMLRCIFCAPSINQKLLRKSHCDQRIKSRCRLVLTKPQYSRQEANLTNQKPSKRENTVVFAPFKAHKNIARTHAHPQIHTHTYVWTHTHTLIDKHSITLSLKNNRNVGSPTTTVNTIKNKPMLSRTLRT